MGSRKNCWTCIHDDAEHEACAADAGEDVMEAIEKWGSSEEWAYVGRRHRGWSGIVKMPPKSTTTPCPGYRSRLALTTVAP